MTVKNIMDVLICDRELNISVQRKINGEMTEIYNDSNVFVNKDITLLYNEIVEYLKIENKTLYILLSAKK